MSRYSTTANFQDKNLKAAYGFDHMTGDGYFLQIWEEIPKKEDNYLEHGLMGTGKSKFMEKVEKYKVKVKKEHLQLIALDLPI